MTKDEMLGWFKSAPQGSRHQRMLWAAQKIARLTEATDGDAYQKLLIALIEGEKGLDPREFEDCNIDCLRKRWPVSAVAAAGQPMD